MTDTISRQAVIDAIGALSSQGSWASSHVAISRALAAINAISSQPTQGDAREALGLDLWEQANDQ